ncbi:YeaH/YhbH family protein [Candidatus Enterovibrio altilux]|uniref:UPF0229 protein BTN50_0349 n=1 Tax=Candidatus Enterovibrio altilux TaxID=1927128 RepID=A0A291B7B0_9GAMM|nr:YeaH/YhbH family protein [Candidatus Enterovibrio luxaltus]ATF08885.1 hypothetical protein BTN50_0349 [Candidatus Enterovibrio luxaltus]
MTHFIDRRLNGKNKSTVNRQRFLRRHKRQIKKSIADAVTQRSITDVHSGENITIPSRDIREPTFHQGKGGQRDAVHAGNDQFIPGDCIERPLGHDDCDHAGKGKASQDGEGQDDFIFQISKDEYLNLLFEDLELPNLRKNQITNLIEYKTYRSGFKATGIPANIAILRSLKNSLARRTAMSAGKHKKFKELEIELAALTGTEPAQPLEEKRILEEIQILKEQIAAVPFIDTFDFRFKNYEKRPQPSSQAVMFCLMDVSGSMDQGTKDIAKRFYILLYLFLTRTYKSVKVVFIRHHTQAKEVDEHEFFHSQETGGTIVSSALRLMDDVIKSRYSSNAWNVYAAQASDGDNWADDSPCCRELLERNLLPVTRYYSYIEITRRAHQTLWCEYENLNKKYDNFTMQNIQTVDDIFPVFKKLFKKQVS